MEVKQGFRIEHIGEVRWCSDAVTALAHLSSILDEEKVKHTIHPDFNLCFMKKTTSERVIACVFKCKNCEERRGNYEKLKFSGKLSKKENTTMVSPCCGRELPAHLEGVDTVTCTCGKQFKPEFIKQYNELFNKQ